MTSHSSRKNWMGFGLALIGAFGVLSFLLAITGSLKPGEPAWFAAAWGDLLFKSFHVVGLYLPVYLLILGLRVFVQKPGLRLTAFLSLGFIPALFAALALRLMFSQDYADSPMPAWFATNLTHEGGVIVSAALALISLIVLLQAPGFLKTGQKAQRLDTDEEAARTAMDSGLEPEAVPEFEPRDSRFEDDDTIAPGQMEETILPRADETKSMERRSERAAAGSGSAIDDFHQAMNGKLESRIRSPSPKLVDVDAPLDRKELKRMWADEEIEKTQVAVLDGNYEPRRPMFYDADETDDESFLEVYFGKDGMISDYPPKNKRSWVTAYEDPESRPEAETVSSRVTGPETRTALLERVSESESQFESEETPEILEELSPDSPDQGAFESEMTSSPVPKLAARSEVDPRSEVDEEDEVLDELDEDDSSEVPGVPEETVDTDVLPPLSEKTSAWDEGYSVPIKGILDEPQNHEYWIIDEATTRAASVLKATLEEFGIQAEVTGIRKGPVITMFEILPAHGVKLARIVNLADNIALRLAAQSVRIVAPIPGKHAVGIEIPNKQRAIVSFAELLMAEGFRAPKVEIPVALGKDITGDAQIVDLTKTPHLLIAGATGSGKSVCVNALICSILYRRSPAEVNLILIDPKIVELKFYNDVPHLLTPVITDPKRAFQALQWCLYEMERRYSLLDAMQVRDIKSYNKKIAAKNIATPRIPYLVVVIDEFADLMATSGKELESTLARLAAMSRAVGIHLVLATQRPSTDVITGLIKANIPSRIAFMVASKIDSRIIIDGMGAEKLLGKGDMLFTSAWDPFPFRMQGAFLSEEEVERIVAYVKTLGTPDYIDDEIFFSDDEDDPDSEDYEDGADDPLMKEAIDIVVSAKKASASYLQRRLKVGYNRAARMVEQMEEMGIVGPQNGSKAREILRMFQ